MQEAHKPLDGTVLLGYRDSIAHNMYVPSTDPNSIDDVDLLEIVLAEPKYYLGLSDWGSRGTKDFWDGHYDCVYYDIRKAVSLFLQGNPNILSMLWLEPEHYLLLEDAGRRLIEARDWFVGKHVYSSFAGYASGQLQRMESRDPEELRKYLAVTHELKFRGAHPNHKGTSIPYPDGYYETRGEGFEATRTSTEKLTQALRSYQKKGENLGYMGDKRKQLVLEHGYDSKNAAHCIRLLRMCKEFLTDGIMRVKRVSDREELLSIKRGQWPLSQIKELAEQLFSEVKTARDHSPLPEEPQRKLVEDLLVDILLNHCRERN